MVYLKVIVAYTITLFFMLLETYTHADFRESSLAHPHFKICNLFPAYNRLFIY